MSAAELLEQVKRLPEVEREHFIDELLRIETDPLPKSESKPVHWPDVVARAKLIVGEQTFENLVLKERQSLQESLQLLSTSANVERIRQGIEDFDSGKMIEREIRD